MGSPVALLVVAAFAASLVEMVEALTIVLAIGVTRGWRASLTGAGAALVVLAVAVAAFGPTLERVPINELRVVVGTLLLCFGVQWLRKAVLRAGGVKALHDEDEIYRETAAAAIVAFTATSVPAATSASVAKGPDRRSTFDWYGWTVSFKGVLLEGLEVVFIVLTFGATQGRIGVAAGAAGAAAVLVAAVGIAVHRPLARVPENSLKFVVGILLTSFGMFWSSEGVGARWPGGDLFLLVVIGVVGALAALVATALRRQVVPPAVAADR